MISIFQKPTLKRSYCLATQWLSPCVLLFFFLAAIPTTLLAVEVNTSIGSNTIPVGGYTYLSIRVEGTTRADVEIPTVSGLILRDSGTSQNTSIINGHITKSAIVRITILGDKEGTYTIPSFPVIVDKETHQTDPVSITVTNNPQAQSGTTQSGNSRSSDNLTAEDIRKIARIVVETDASRVFVGQKVPVTIQLWVNQAHRFDNLSAPVVQNEHILMDTLGQDYKRTVEYEGNERFEVYSWQSSFTPLKTGETNLTAETEVTVLVRARRRTSAFDSIFDSDFFSPSYRRIPLLIKSENTALDIKNLPEEQPEAFTGAVGVFDLNVKASPTEITLGDPITLDIEISGKGNFDRVFHDGLGKDTGFKTYTPEETFESDPTNPLRGTKTFKQAIIPNQPDLNEIPPVSFVYFDTDEAAFKTLSSGPVLIQVESDPAISNSLGTTSDREPSSGLNVVASDGWIPLQLELDTPSNRLTPIILKPFSWAILTATPTTLLLFSFLLPTLISRSRRDKNLKITELKRKLKSIEKALNQSQHEESVSGFINYSSQYSREILGTLWDVSPQSITTADTRQRMGDSYPALKEIMQLNDSMQYAGGMANDLDLKDKRNALELEWKQLIEIVERS